MNEELIKRLIAVLRVVQIALLEGKSRDSIVDYIKSELEDINNGK